LPKKLPIVDQSVGRLHPIQLEYGFTMAQKLKRIAIIVIGWIFLLLGVAGLFLPILQGVLFILIGLMILSTEYAWAHHLLSKLKARFPKLAQAADSAALKANGWMRRISGQQPAD
jgi:hypothetical protein